MNTIFGKNVKLYGKLLLFVEHFTPIILSEGYEFFPAAHEACINHKISISGKKKQDRKYTLTETEKLNTNNQKSKMR